MSDAAKFDDTPDFSLMLGGPLYQLFLRLRMAKPPLDLLTRRMIIIPLIAWLPLLLMSALGGQVVGGGITVPFLSDLGVHVRFLLALPLLIAAEVIVHQHMRPILGQLLQRGIVPPDARPRFHACVESAMRLRNSILAEVLLIAFVYTAGHQLWKQQLVLHTATWYASVVDGVLLLSPAGYWYAFVSIPIYQFIFLRWYFRLFIWFRFLWQVSRLDLRLIPTHPDRAGGLGILGNTAFMFAPILSAQGAVLSGVMAGRIFFAGQSLQDFTWEIVGLVVVLVVLVHVPLMVFTPHLLRAKREGRREYGALASRYVSEFDQKWIRADPPEREPLVGSADIQSLADLANSFEVVNRMQPVPFGKETIILLVVATALPVLPLMLTMFPLDELIKRLLGILL